MKTVKQTEKRNEGKQAVKAHEGRNGAAKTPKQISAHEYRNELGFLRHVMERTNMSPAEIAEGLKHIGKPDEGEAYLEWLESMPARPKGEGPRYVTLKVDVDLAPEDWMVLAQLAQFKNEPIGGVIDDLLTEAIVEFMNGETVAGLTLTPEVAR